MVVFSVSGGRFCKIAWIDTNSTLKHCIDILWLYTIYQTCLSRIGRKIATNDPNSMFLPWIERRDSYLLNDATINDFEAIDAKLH